MIQWMLLLVILAMFFSLINSRDKGLDQIISGWVIWTGWLWILIPGAMFGNEILRSIGAPNIRIFQSGSWQPLGPMVLGAILLFSWHRRQAKHN